MPWKPMIQRYSECKSKRRGGPDSGLPKSRSLKNEEIGMGAWAHYSRSKRRVRILALQSVTRQRYLGAIQEVRKKRQGGTPSARSI